MKRLEKIIERQLPYATLLGPLVILAALFIIIIKVAPNEAYIPLVALIGVLLCWKWKLQGMAAAICLLAATVFYRYQGDPLWHIGMASSLALAFLITALSFEEVDAQLSTRQSESNGQLESQLKMIQGQIQILEQTCNEREERLMLQDKTIDVIRLELTSAHSQQEKLTEELFHKQRDLAAAQKIHNAAQEEITVLRTQSNDSENDKIEIHSLTKQLHQQKQTLADLHTQLQNSQEEFYKIGNQLEQSTNELIAEKERNAANLAFSEQAQWDQVLQQTVLHEMQEHIETVSREKALLETMLTQLQKEQEALKNQEYQQTSIINSHLTTIEKLEQAIEQHEETRRREEAKAHEFSITTAKKEQLHSTLVEELTNKLSLTKHQLEESERGQKVLQNTILERDSTLTEWANREKATLQKHLHDAERNNVSSQLTEARHASSRNEGLYFQLREQFAEKAAHLDHTRRELFYTQEKVASLQLKLQEIAISQPYEENRGIDSLLLNMEQEYAEIYHDTQKEIDALHDLIATLLDQ